MATAETTNINSTTTDLWRKSFVPQVLMQNPLIVRMLQRKRVVIGGKATAIPVDMAEFTDVAQSYGENEVLTNQDVSFVEGPKFEWKMFQVPLQYSIMEKLKNAGSSQIVDLLAAKVTKGQRAGKLKMRKMLYDATTTEDGTDFTSLCLALDHSRTYGAITTSGVGTKPWWNGASLSGAYTDRAAAIAASIGQFRDLLSCVQTFNDAKPSEYLAVVGSSLFRKFQEQQERRHVYSRDGSMLAKFGFNAQMIDGVEFVTDSYLERDPGTNAINTTRNKYFFLLHIPSFTLEFAPGRAFNFSGYTHQASQVNGKDFWLGRVMTAGKFYTSQPGASIWRSNMS